MQKSTELLERYLADLQLGGYAERTQRTYHHAMVQLWEHCDCPVEQITEEQLREYLLFCKNEKCWESSTLCIAYNGIRRFFEQTLIREWKLFHSVKFEKQVKLPVVLNIDEVSCLLKALPTLQSRAYYTLVYSCGLRLNEAIHLKVCDIDGKRMCIHVHHGKRAKDRVLPLPQNTRDILIKYWLTHKNKVWLFPSLGRSGLDGATADRPVSPTTLAGSLKRGLKRTKILKSVHTHTFRHSFATHMIEADVPISHVQEWLGHNSLYSTMVYAHITSHGRESSRRRLNQLMGEVLS